MRARRSSSWSGPAQAWPRRCFAPTRTRAASRSGAGPVRTAATASSSRRAHASGPDCSVRLPGRRTDSRATLRRSSTREGAGDPFVDETGPADVAVDALFDTGFAGTPREAAAEAIAELNGARRRSCRSTCPRGRRFDREGRRRGRTGVDHGHLPRAQGRPCRRAGSVPHGPARRRRHRPCPVPTRIRRVTAQILELVPSRTEEDNKYTAGSVLVVGGSRGLTGAPSLSSEAALRAGAGIVTACVPASLNLVFEQRLVEVMTRPCADEDGAMTPEAADEILAAAERAGAVALGPGLGRTDGTRASSASCSTAWTGRSSSTPTGSGPSPATSTGSSPGMRRPSSRRMRASSAGCSVGPRPG